MEIAAVKTEKVAVNLVLDPRFLTERYKSVGNTLSGARECGCKGQTPLSLICALYFSD